MTLFVLLAGSAPMAFSVQSIIVWKYSFKLLAGHFLCKSPAACTYVAIGEYTSPNFCLISCHLRSLPILFNILYGVLVDLVVTTTYSLLFVKAANFSICNSQSSYCMFFPWYMVMSLMGVSYSCCPVIFFIMSSDCFCKLCSPLYKSSDIFVNSIFKTGQLCFFVLPTSPMCLPISWCKWVCVSATNCGKWHFSMFCLGIVSDWLLLILVVEVFTFSYTCFILMQI